MVLEEGVIEGRKVFVNILKIHSHGSELQLSGWFRRIVDDADADHSLHPDQENPFCRGFVLNIGCAVEVSAVELFRSAL